LGFCYSGLEKWMRRKNWKISLELELCYYSVWHCLGFQFYWKVPHMIIIGINVKRWKKKMQACKMFNVEYGTE